MVLNIVQLIGWTTFELVIMREGTAAIGKQSFGLSLDSPGGIVVTTLLWGVVLTALMAGSMLALVRQFISRFGLPLVIASLLWLTWQFGGQLQAKGMDAFWARPGNGGMGLWSAIDLVIAMPVSWLPLVADYARHGRNGKSTMTGTWIGYAIANMWCYALGVMVVSLAEPGTNLVTTLLLAQGGLIALGVILGRLSFSGPAASRPDNLPKQGADILAALLWITGIALYHAIATWMPQWGSALPTLQINGLYRHGFLVAPAVLDAVMEQVQTGGSALAKKFFLRMDSDS